MKTYFAGVPGGGTSGLCRRERELMLLWDKRLWTYYWLTKDNGIMPETKNKVELFLDSGAFSAWSQGKEINIQDYISFIKEHEDVIDVYANLDVIGDPKSTWRNQQIMEQTGLKPLPVFHYGEDEKWLRRYLDKNYDCISLGGMVPISTSNLIPWLNRLFSKYLTDSEGVSIIKVHGFGLTSLPLILRYPWYSVDSTSWVITGRMGSVYIPRYKNGEWIYNENSWKVAVSTRSPNTKEAGKHIETLTPIEKRIILNYIHKKGYKLGSSTFKKVDQSYKPDKNERWFDKKPKNKSEKREIEIIHEPGISNKYQLRDEMNIIYFLDLEKSMPEWPWVFKKEEVQNGFFE